MSNYRKRTGSSSSGTRYSRIPVSVRLDTDTLQLIDTYIQRQDHPPSFSGVMRMAINQFLRSKMYDL